MSAPHKPFESLPDRLRTQIAPHPCGCWLWTGRLNRNGYGRIRWQGLEPVTHRLVYELLVGDIPHGYLLDHLADRCASRACCNPAHLEPVTPRVNTQRGRAVLFTPAKIGWVHSRGRPRELSPHLMAQAQTVLEEIPF